MSRRRASAMALKTSDVVEERATAPTYADIDICQATGAGSPSASARRRDRGAATCEFGHRARPRLGRHARTLLRRRWVRAARATAPHRTRSGSTASVARSYSPTRRSEPVLRRPRRPAAAALGAALLIPALAACGDSSGKDSGSDSKAGSSAGASATPELTAVTFSGDVGKELTPKWHSTVDAPKSSTVTTLVKGSGSTIADGDTVSAYLYLGDGTTKKDAYSDYTNGSPESIPNDDKLSDLFSKILSDATYGSRVAAVTSAAELF